MVTLALEGDVQVVADAGLIEDGFADEFEQESGLGLPICKIIVEKLSGRLGVSSEVGEGSCFSVYLPLADA